MKNLQIQFFENIDSTPEIVQKPFPVPYKSLGQYVLFHMTYLNTLD